MGADGGAQQAAATQQAAAHVRKQQTSLCNLSLSCSDDDTSDSSCKCSFEAILFETDEAGAVQGQQGEEDSDFASDEAADELELSIQRQKAENESQIEQLVRIPKKQQRQRSRLDLIKVVRTHLRQHQQLPVLEELMKQQGITRKRAKRAIVQVMREKHLKKAAGTSSCSVKKTIMAAMTTTTLEHTRRRRDEPTWRMRCCRAFTACAASTAISMDLATMASCVSMMASCVSMMAYANLAIDFRVATFIAPTRRQWRSTTSSRCSDAR